MAEATRLLETFGEIYSALVSGDYARNEARRGPVALSKI